MDYKPLFFLDAMLTPKIITFIYWLSLVVVMFSALAIMFQVSFLKGLFILILGPIAVRLYCEFIVVIFKIYENLKKIADRKEEENK